MSADSQHEDERNEDRRPIVLDYASNHVGRGAVPEWLADRSCLAAAVLLIYSVAAQAAQSCTPLGSFLSDLGEWVLRPMRLPSLAFLLLSAVLCLVPSYRSRKAYLTLLLVFLSFIVQFVMVRVDDVVWGL